MISPAQHEIVQAAEQVYATKLKSLVEPSNNGEFIAIEPVSGEFFLGKTLSSAIQAARRKHPRRLPYAMRVGIDATVHLGTWR